MIKFFIRLGVIQTVFYGCIYLIAITDDIKFEDKELMKLLVIIFYSISMGLTCIAPLVKLIYDEFKNKIHEQK